MLDELGVAYRYREYREEPLTMAELREVLELLGKEPRELLRPKEAKALGIADDLPDAELLEAMAGQPTLVQRPIAILGGRAIIARPADTLSAFLA